MKNLDKVELGKRLWRYFMGCGCQVTVCADSQGQSSSRKCYVHVSRTSKWTGKDFQTRKLFVSWQSPSPNDSFDAVARKFADWYCGDRASGWGQRDVRDEFVTAASAEELDLKLSSRGY